MKSCNWCDHTFEPTVSYQVYCSPECRESATKEKISQRYIQTRRQKRKGKNRICKECGSKLSIYNDDSLCNKCSINPNDVKKAIKQIKGMSNDQSKRNR
jgi:hypothetical protein